MLKILLVKLREALWSVLPVTAIVMLLSFTPLIDFTAREKVIFLICSVLLVVGIALFNLGADMAMTPMGVHVGSGLSKSGRIWLLLSVCAALGLLITVAEPDLSVLAKQVSAVIDPMRLILFVGVGVGLFLLLAVLKIVAKVSLSRMLLFFYMILFAFAALMAVNGNQALLSLSFDSGGVTTGPITVPFIMALGTGIANALGGKDAGENSFGLVALCSVGPIVAVMMLGAFANGTLLYTPNVADYAISAQPFSHFFHTVWEVMGEVGIALGLIVAFFMVLQVTCLRLPSRKLSRMAFGILYTFLGLVIFLAAVTMGFMPIGYKLGAQLASARPAVLVLFGFLLGLVVVLAEPAVQVLNKQVEEITSGTVSKRAMMVALSIGVGISIGLSMLRIIFDFSILYYLIPGYVISLGLSFFVPKLYTAIAFDSGGVASGPLTSGFILPLAVGACTVIQPHAILSDAFGIVAMVAMTPLITIQIMGFRAIVARKVRDNIMMKNILDADDEQIIDFM
ncbi:MAG: DUF1538 domain-containing protein [Ruminococcaceae bacterium]|nr:DUF1538 domain-containing protein [Oscillospiraceae bacterium]